MVTDYIPREAVIKYLRDCSGGYDYIEIETESAINDIKAIPAADVGPVVRGRWIDYNPDDWYDPRMKCSRCGCVALPLSTDVFCSKCGADLRDVVESNHV